MKWPKEIITWLALPYLFLMSAMFHVGYWSQFNIDILNFIGLQDAINGILFPIVENLAPFAIMLTLLYLINLYYPKVDSYVRRLSSFGKVLFASAAIIAGVIGTIATSILLEEPLNFGIPLNDDFKLRIRITKGITSLFLLAAILQVYFYLSGTYKNKPRHKMLIFSTLITILLYSFTVGYANSVKIKEGIAYKFTETNLLNNPEGLEDCSKLIYLGKGGDFFLYATPDFQRTLVVSQSDFKNLVLKNYKKPVKLTA